MNNYLYMQERWVIICEFTTIGFWEMHKNLNQIIGEIIIFLSE